MSRNVFEEMYDQNQMYDFTSPSSAHPPQTRWQSPLWTLTSSYPPKLPGNCPSSRFVGCVGLLSAMGAGVGDIAKCRGTLPGFPTTHPGGFPKVFDTRFRISTPLRGRRGGFHHHYPAKPQKYPGQVLVRFASKVREGHCGERGGTETSQ